MPHRSLHVPPVFAERHPGRTIAAIGVLFACAYAASLVLLPKANGQIVLGDAIEHYVQLRSPLFDRDLQFLNDYAGLYRVDERAVEAVAIENAKITARGYVRNYMPVGPALMWAPLFLLVSAGVWLVNAAGGAYPLDGFARPFQASAGFSGIIAATIGSWFAFRAAALLVDRRSAIWATLTVWLSSSALYYSLVSPAYSHAASMLAAGAFWWFWIRTADRQDVSRYVALGLLAGIAALMRWQDAMLLAVPAIDALWSSRGRGLPGVLARIAACSAAAAVAFIPQMAVWYVLYGEPLTVPQGPGFMRWSQPALAAVLLSDNHGLLTWTPIVGLALGGLVLLWWHAGPERSGLRPSGRDRPGLHVSASAPLVATGAIVFFAATWYVNAAVADWWAGEAFGARRFISAYPVFVLGVAAVFARLRARPRWIFGISAAFIAYTFLLLVHYQAFMHRLLPGVPYPRGFAGLWLARFRVPFDLLAHWVGT